MRVLVTGANGQLGRDLTAFCEEAGDEVLALSKNELDIRDAASVAAAVAQSHPDVIVNCAAWTAVDACESDPERAASINGAAVAGLAEIAEQSGAHLVQISTDYVFDGSKAEPYSETDEPNPNSVYGRSKLLGEVNAGSAATVMRTSWVYSTHGANMVATICRLMQGESTLQFVDDQVGYPSYTGDLAVAIRDLARDRSSGVWHCTNAGAVSWHGFAQEVLLAAGEDPARVLPIKTDELDPPRPATRPANSRLSNDRYNATYSPLPDFRQNLQSVVASYL